MMKHRRDTFRAAVIVTALAASLLASIPAAMAVDPAIEPLPPGGTFADDNLIPQEGYIEAIASVGVTKGCVSGEVELFCPDRAVTRAEMAAFIVRALDIPAVTTNTFTDTATSVHVWDIAALHAKGITKGCNPPLADQFCPERTVTRGQMAAFISRAFDLTGDVDRARFTDDDDSLFELEISRAAAAGSRWDATSIGTVHTSPCCERTWRSSSQMRWVLHHLRCHPRHRSRSSENSRRTTTPARTAA